MKHNSKENRMSENQNLSRRDFLRKAGMGTGLAAGALLLGTSPLFAAESTSVVAEEAFPLAEIDPDEARLRGHAGYYVGGCAYGAFYSLLSLLREKVGGPYNQIPFRTLKYGEGGLAGWGTICGALNGSAAIITLAAPNADYGKIINELMGWYTVTPFPSEASNKLAAAGGFIQTAKKDYPRAILAQSVSGSPLCHASVSKWCDTAKMKSSSAERKERCARLTADVASRAAELLNAYKKGTFAASFAMDAQTMTCLGCHAEDQVGKMSCTSCHDPH